MSKRKLKIVSWGAGSTDSDRNASYITLYFPRVLSSIEQEGIVAIVKERLSNGK